MFGFCEALGFLVRGGNADCEENSGEEDEEVEEEGEFRVEGCGEEDCDGVEEEVGDELEGAVGAEEMEAGLERGEEDVGCLECAIVNF